MHQESPPGSNSNRPLFLMDNFCQPHVLCSLILKKWHGFVAPRPPGTGGQKAAAVAHPPQPSPTHPNTPRDPKRIRHRPAQAPAVEPCRRMPPHTGLVGWSCVVDRQLVLLLL